MAAQVWQVAQPRGRAAPRHEQGTRHGDAMSRPRFLADHDLREQIVDGVRRREPAIEFFRARDFGLQERGDDELLAFAAQSGFMVVSHDVNTMPGIAMQRVERDQAMHGLLMVQQRRPFGPVIESLIAIWAASEAEEWIGKTEFLPL